MPYLDTLPEPGEEEVRTIEEDIYVIGVESLNGQTGDLTLKTINNTDLVGEGNIEVTTASDVAEAVNAEAEAREQADTQIQNTLSTKQDQLTANQLAAVNSGIDQTKVAQIATNAGDITTIEGKIPDQATSENKLADKNFVNSSIATNTAYYISDNGEPFQSVADLEAYSGPLTNNDYAFVVGTDAAGNTTYTRYKYNAATNEWAEEYVLNNSSFTSDQWTAINSGATSELIAQITTNKNDIATKQDKLIAGDNIQIAADGKTISATSTTYTAGTGLTLTGTEFSVTNPVPSGFFTGSAAQEGEGTSFALQNTTAAPLKSAGIKGDATQQDDPSPSPTNPQAIKIVTGEQTVTVNDDGSNSQSYTIDLSTIELCKIGTYQDYIYKSNGNWYKHAEVGKVILTGASDEAWATGGNSAYAYHTIDNAYQPANRNTVSLILSDYYMTNVYNRVASTTIDYGIALDSDNAGRLAVRNKDYPTASNLKSWLSTHNTTVYYVLATATDTVITGATLIAQLDALWNARSYAPMTVVTSSASTPNLPAIVSVEAFNANWAGTIAAIYEEIGGVEAALNEVNNGGNA